jgi:hypothetical protein
MFAESAIKKTGQWWKALAAGVSIVMGSIIMFSGILTLSGDQPIVSPVSADGVVTQPELAREGALRGAAGQQQVDPGALRVATDGTAARRFAAAGGHSTSHSDRAKGER